MGASTVQALDALRQVYGETAASAAQILQRIGYPCLEIAVAISKSYAMPFSEILPIMRTIGCAPAENCEYPPPTNGVAKIVTANLLWFLPSAFEPLPAIAGHGDDFDTSLLNFFAIDVFEVAADGSRTLVSHFAGDADDRSGELVLRQNFYMFTWKPDEAQRGRNFQVRYSVAGLDLGFTPIATADTGSLPFKFRVDNHPVIRARVLHAQAQSADQIAQALANEFDLVAEELVRLLYEESFSPGEIGIALHSPPLEAAKAFHDAGLGAASTLQMLSSGLGETNVTNNVLTLRVASFPVTEVWLALEVVL